MAKKKIANTADLSHIEAPKIYKKGEIIEGIVIDSKQNQMIVNISARAEGIVTGKELKLHGERVEKKPGEKVLVYVVNPENEEGMVELSIRKTGDARKWHDLLEAKESEKTIKVKVVEANTGGVIVEMGGGLRGFVPSSQLKNERIYNDTQFSSKDDAKKKLQAKLIKMIGEDLEVKVMEIDRNQDRVILSEKMVDSESNLEQRNETLGNIKVGDTIEGKVTGVAPFGLFVNAAGLEGLVHLSEISWDKVTNPADFYSIGTNVKVQVIGINDDGKRVAYSIKRLQEDPWKTLVKKYKSGQIVEGVISSIADYGAFVKIENGLNGLIHISELSNKLVKDPRKIVKEGEPVKVMIISISNEDRHLGLSLKRVKSDSKEEGEEEATPEEEKNNDASTESSREMEGLDKILNSEE